jgi:hypothetical protein
MTRRTKEEWLKLAPKKKVWFLQVCPHCFHEIDPIHNHHWPLHCDRCHNFDPVHGDKLKRIRVKRG